MDQIKDISKHEFKDRDAYKADTKAFLNQIKEIDEDKRKEEVIKLLVKLYDDLMNSIEIGKETGVAINDDAIEGILAIANTCIEEQKEKLKDSDGHAKLEEDLNDILKNGTADVKARVNAFYSLCTKHRRMKDYSKFKDLLDQERNSDVGRDVIFIIMQAYYYIQETANDFNLQKALTSWQKDISDVYKRLPAFTQIYTETVILQCEATNKQDPELLKESEDLIEMAIDMRKYAKFYSTRGRIYSCNGDYDKGIEDVRLAIDTEDSSREDYMSRISEYQSLISRFQRKKDEKELKEQADKIRAELDKSKKDYISILGFFSAVMALIIGSTEIIKVQRPMIESLQLLMGIAGMLIMSFGSLNLILVRRDEKRTNKYSELTLLVIGVFMFVLMFLVKILHNYLQTNNWI